MRVFDIRGTTQQGDLRQSLLEMSLTSELTKSDKGLYHVQICPAYGEDRKMTDADWIKAVDIMELETGYTGQKRAIVMHEKNGKVHAHVVWERYDHDKGIMIPNKFSRLAQDRARIQMEKEFEHIRTPERNKHRPEMKQYLTDIWQQTKDAGEFMQTIGDKGYVIAAGMQRPYMVIDNTGRSFDLVRQLDGVKTREVRERFKATRLVKEKEAIAQVRTRQTPAKQLKQEKSTVEREALKNIANDNIRQVAVQQQNEPITYTMQVRFSMENQTVQQEEEVKKPVTQDIDDKQARRQAVLDKLKRQRLGKAKRFRENDFDMTDW